VVPEVLTPELLPPGRSLEQRMSALGHANHVRIRNGHLKRELKALPKRDSLQATAGYLRDPRDTLLSAKVMDVLLAVTGIGRVKANRLLTVARISSTKRIGGLTVRQRVELARMLEELARA
jgi:hypothetical protein